MITCNKCGYDKAVQGLNEIWCDKCDVLDKIELKKHTPFDVPVMLSSEKEEPVEYVNELPAQTTYKVADWYNLCSDFGLERLGGTFTRSSHSTHLANEPVTYYSNALPSQPFDDAIGECGIQTVVFDDNQHAEHIRLHQKLRDAALGGKASEAALSVRTLAGQRDPWERADAYVNKQDICRFVTDFFHNELAGCWLNLSHGDYDNDTWSAVLCANGNPIVSYYHKNIHDLCYVLDVAFCERDDAPEDSIRDVVRAAIEAYFDEE